MYQYELTEKSFKIFIEDPLPVCRQNHTGNHLMFICNSELSSPVLVVLTF